MNWKGVVGAEPSSDQLTKTLREFDCYL